MRWLAVWVLWILVAAACSRSSSNDPIAPLPPTPSPPISGPIAVPGTVYYVAPTGDDRNDGLSPATALRTLGFAVQRLSPGGGDKLVLQGLFQESLRLEDINPAGDPALPTVIEAAFDSSGSRRRAGIDGGIQGASQFPFDRGGRPPGFGAGEGQYLTRGIEIVRSNHVTLAGLEVRGIAGRGVATSRCHHLTLESLWLEWLSETALFITNGEPFEPLARDLTIRNCRINQSNLGSWQNRATQSGYNMKTETVSIQRYDGFLVEGNHLSNSWMEGIDFKLGSRDGVIRHNLVENTRSAGIYANEGESVRIYRNVIRHIGWYDPEDGTGLTLAAPYMTTKLLTTAREDGATGILIANGDLDPLGAYETGRVGDLDIYENVVSWTRKGGIAVNNEWRIEGRSGWNLDGIRIYHNVVHHSCDGLGAAAVTLDVGMTNGLFANNVITRSQEFDILVTGLGQGAFFSSNAVTHNLLWDNSGSFELGVASIEASPEFRQIPNLPGSPASFELAPASPAIGAGLTLGLTGVPFSMPDIGAYQTRVPKWEAGLTTGS